MSRKLTSTELKRLHRSWRRLADGRVALLLDGVQTPYNVGAIVRTAAAFRVEHLYLAGATALPTAPGARKISLGTERFVPWSEHADGAAAARAARADGFALVGVELTDDAEPIHRVELPQDVCLALGHEEHGLSTSTVEAVERVVYVPLAGRVGSLNVATAAALALYETRRRSWSST